MPFSFKPNVLFFFVIMAFVLPLLGATFLSPRFLRERERVSEENTKLEIGARAPEFNLASHEGVSVSLSSFIGKSFVIVNFWAAWCPFCLEELNDFEEFAGDYRESVTILAVNRGESRETVTGYLEQIQPADNLIFLLDLEDTVYAKYMGRVMPYSVFIDSSGIIRDIKFGPMNLEEMQTRTNRLMNR